MAQYGRIGRKEDVVNVRHQKTQIVQIDETVITCLLYLKLYICIYLPRFLALLLLLPFPSVSADYSLASFFVMLCIYIKACEAHSTTWSPRGYPSEVQRNPLNL